MKKLRFGVLSTAKIGTNLVIPGMQNSELCEITAISSRNLQKAKLAAMELDIPKFYGSYEELLADPQIDAVYNPLPNHLHVPLTKKALEAGKHVLCEKPISITAEQAEDLINLAGKYPHLKVMEAFMYRFHPQWQKVKELISSGEIGDLKYTHSVFGYFNNNPENIRNQADMGGGGLLDIGCYCINFSRMIFGEEPSQVHSYLEMDPNFGTDRLAVGSLKFSKGVAHFMCSTQTEANQSAAIHGSKGFITMNIPFNAANENTRKVTLHKNGEHETFFFEICDHYTLQGDAFARAVLDNTPVPISLEDTLGNMRVITAMVNNAPK
jgi:predicted dehydrogenase